MSPQNPAVPDPPGRRWRSSPKPTEGFQRVAVKSSARTRKALVLSGLILALAGAAAAWLFWPQGLPATGFITIPVREYDKFPANAFALQDSELLLGRFPESLRSKEYGKQEHGRLLSTLAGLQSRKDEALVVHLQAHAVRDDKGVYVLPSDADPGVPATWIPLQDVLMSLRNCPAKHKLLLLDLMRPVADAKLGILADDVAEGVKAELDKEETPGLLILCACAPGQVSLVSEDLQLSVFGYYVDQGLSGRADGYTSRGRGSRDERVTVRELAEYLRGHVDRWARHNRGTRQTPVLYGKSEDFPLVPYDQEQLQPLGDLPAPEPLLEKVRIYWEMRDAWQAVGLHRRLPGAFLQVEALTLRAEERWRSGIEANRVESELKERALQVRKLALAAVKDPEGPKPHSLALARGRDKPADPVAMESLRGLLAKVAPKSTAKAEEVAKFQAAFQEKFKDTPYEEVAAAVFEAAVKDTELSIAKVVLLDQVLSGWKEHPLYVETSYLQRLMELAQTVKEYEWPWRLDVVNQLLETVREGEKVAAGDPAALPWIKNAAKDADKKMIEGETLLFTKRFDTWDQARTLLREAKLAYSTINDNLGILTRARQARDDALAFLPGYVPYLNRLSDRDQDEVETWQSCLRVALDLHQDLAKPDPAVLSSLEDKRIVVRSKLGKVQGSFDSRQKGFLARDKEKRATVRDYPDFQVLMASPRLDAKQRSVLWSIGRKLAREWLVATRQADEAEARDEPLPGEFAMPGDADLRGAATGSPKRRAQLAIDLLNMGGLQEDETGRLLKKAIGEPSAGNWRLLGANLYKAWAKDLPKQIQAAGASDDWIKLDRLSRVSGLVVQYQQAGAFVDLRRAIPQAEIRRKEVADYRQWLGDRLQAESKAAGSNTPFGKFCAEAAESYQR